MKIIILSGSPKSDVDSVTMHFAQYLIKRLPQVEFEIINVANTVSAMEKNPQQFDYVISRISAANAVLWGFLLYYLLVSSQMKRFIELIFERKAAAAFSSKPAAALATSIHFCDNYALNYIREISEDLGMNYYDHFSAGMDDLSSKEDRTRLYDFGVSFVDFIKSGNTSPRVSTPLIHDSNKLDFSASLPRAISCGKKVVILTDEQEKDDNLRQMTAFMAKSFSGGAEIVNLHAIKINGGCLGCIRCGYDFTCVYDSKDDYRKTFESKIATADIVIFAGSVRDRYLSAKWKQFFDRSFFHNHTPLLDGKQVGMLVSGPLRQMENLRNLFQNYFEVQRVNFCGIVSDDYTDLTFVTAGLNNLAWKLADAAAKGYQAPRTFPGVAGHKLFRDVLYSRLKFPFLMDYRSYKKSGAFDFPQKNWKSLMVANILSVLTRVPKIRQEIYTKGMISGMTHPLKKILNKVSETDA